MPRQSPLYQSIKPFRHAAILGVTLLALSACDRPMSLSASVEHGSNQLAALAGNGSAPVSRERRERGYALVISDLNSAIDAAGEDPATGAAKILIAQATFRQGELAAEETREAGRLLLIDVGQARSKLNLYASHRSLGDSLSVYDPSADFAEIDSEAREIAGSMSSARATLADIEERLAGLQSLMAQEKASTDARRSEESEIRLAAMGRSAVERATMIEEATAIRRVADAHERKFSELELLANGLVQQAARTRMDIASDQDRAALIERSRERIDESSKLLRAEAGTALQEADRTSEEIATRFDALTAALKESVLSPYERAVSKYSSAMSQAQQGRSASSKLSGAVSASAQHASADLHRQYARAVGSLADLAEMLSKTLPDGRRFADEATELIAMRDEAASAAAELYGRAASSYGSVGDRGGNLASLQAGLREFSEPEGGEEEMSPEDSDPGEPDNADDSDDFDEFDEAG